VRHAHRGWASSSCGACAMNQALTASLRIWTTPWTSPSAEACAIRPTSDRLTQDVTCSAVNQACALQPCCAATMESSQHVCGGAPRGRDAGCAAAARVSPPCRASGPGTALPAASAPSALQKNAHVGSAQAVDFRRLSESPQVCDVGLPGNGIIIVRASPAADNPHLRSQIRVQVNQLRNQELDPIVSRLDQCRLRDHARPSVTCHLKTYSQQVPSTAAHDVEVSSPACCEA